MFLRKRYGESQQRTCPFCTRIATQKTKEGLEVCYQHIKNTMQEIKCSCGSWLEQRSGKFGPYFNCLNCGNINLQKAMQMKSLMVKEQQTTQPPPAPASQQTTARDHSPRVPKETTIDTNDTEYFS